MSSHSTGFPTSPPPHPHTQPLLHFRSWRTRRFLTLLCHGTSIIPKISQAKLCLEAHAGPRNFTGQTVPRGTRTTFRGPTAHVGPRNFQAKLSMHTLVCEISRAKLCLEAHAQYFAGQAHGNPQNFKKVCYTSRHTPKNFAGQAVPRGTRRWSGWPADGFPTVRAYIRQKWWVGPVGPV